ncbi:hypothetical protein TKK_0018348 [Trichogramma kaykai]|uniref:Endonuclease/exonuclease/phosphatase domain-containing protein n=1 Tax=Trichogramma kaykai TaxID=54128 RepID=A0ABD2VZH6_9HYME
MANSHSSQTSFNSLRIFFWNVRSIGTKFSEVKKISTEYDIIACVESWLTPDSEYCIPGFHVVRKDRVHTRGGGIAIWVRKNIAFKEIDDTHLHESIEICALQLNNVKPNLNLYVCYRPPGSTLSQADWNQVITETCKHNALLIGDFNALNLQWNCPRTEENGDRLQTAYKLHNVFLHNCDSTTYTNLRSNYTSNLDLVFSTQDIKDKISTEICEETWSSDHHPIFITISVTKSLYHKKKLKLSSKRTKWENFCQRMDENYQYFFSEEFESLSADNKYETFTKMMTDALITSTPTPKTVSPKKHRNPVPWWDDECNSIKQARTDSFKKYKSSLSLHDLISYNKTCAEMKRIIRTKKESLFGRLPRASISERIRPTYGTDVKF